MSMMQKGRRRRIMLFLWNSSDDK